MNGIKHIGLYTDLYELTMAQGYFLDGRQDETACFDYFFRKNPFNGGYVIFAGISDVITLLSELRFDKNDLDYLASQGFRKSFLDFLRNFKFHAEIYSVREGEVVFPYEPVVRLKGSLIETQLVETLLLNLLNFESLIATKASRIKSITGKKAFIDFGLRRSQGWGGIQASKASVIGGADATSNVWAAMKFGLRASGTQAHSWIQSFEDELTAFRKYAEFYPDSCVLLVDTYDTLKSGIPNAITVARELESKGHRLLGVRLDSGDLSYLSRQTRNQLDQAGLDYVKIVASNQLDEYVIKSLIEQNAPIDMFGVGTHLVTAYDCPALDGVYKLSMVHNSPRLKISENITKVNFPGVKNVFRYQNGGGFYYGDGIQLEEEDEITHIYHPHFPEKNVSVMKLDKEPLLHLFMEKGKPVADLPGPYQCSRYALDRLSFLQPEYKRFENPHIYKVGISEKLMKLRNKLVHEKEPTEI